MMWVLQRRAASGSSTASSNTVAVWELGRTWCTTGLTLTLTTTTSTGTTTATPTILLLPLPPPPPPPLLLVPLLLPVRAIAIAVASAALRWRRLCGCLAAGEPRPLALAGLPGTLGPVGAGISAAGLRWAAARLLQCRNGLGLGLTLLVLATRLGPVPLNGKIWRGETTNVHACVVKSRVHYG